MRLSRSRTTLAVTTGIIVLYRILTPAFAQNSDASVLHGHVTLADLPKGIEQRAAVGLSRDQIAQQLAAQPSIVLDNAVLEITAPPVGASRSLMLNRLELRNGSRIVTNGVNLEIDAVLIASESGGILAFEDKPREAAPVGQNGAGGLDGGTVVLDAQLNHNDLLHIELKGQRGQLGGRGVPGPQGAQGPRGESGADHLFDCAHGAGDGGAGSAGGAGGTGGQGGPGGAGGTLILRGALTSQRNQVEFLAPGGQGAKGGDGGPGGAGGPGGEGGSGTTYCRSGHGGPRGADGPVGEHGKDGLDGPKGRIAAD